MKRFWLLIKNVLGKIWNLGKKPKTLVILITSTSFLAIVISASMFFVDNNKNNLDFSAIYKNELTNRFVQKHDLLRLTEAISHLNFYIGKKDGQDLFANLPLESSFVEQAYLAYLGMNTNNWNELVCIPPTITADEYIKAIDISSIDNANNFIFSSFRESQKLETIQNYLFWFLIFTQVLNALFAIALFYQEGKKHI